MVKPEPSFFCIENGRTKSRYLLTIWGSNQQSMVCSIKKTWYISYEFYKSPDVKLKVNNNVCTYHTALFWLQVLELQHLLPALTWLQPRHGRGCWGRGFPVHILWCLGLQLFYDLEISENKELYLLVFDSMNGNVIVIKRLNGN